jgi:putative phosphoribosyl transferase
MAERVFADRDEAGRALSAAIADRMSAVADTMRVPAQRLLVLGLPRGGVPVARRVADAVVADSAVVADFDVIVARKIGVPWQPEFGVGAVTADGPPLFDLDALRHLRLDPQALAPMVERERAEARRWLRRYRGDRPPPPITGRLVIVVDDGLATGVTARAALRSVRDHWPARLVFAAPVCAPAAVAALAGEADEVICVQQPADFEAVGAWYDDFTQLTDADVDHYLAAGRVVRPR